ncbi:MAG: ADP-glyceromanno-heptose 6-epimerase [bacterium]|nr:ADP-glyceromanno-heptose 6-epimerase [bacterium]
MLILTGGAGFIGSRILAALNAEGRSDVLIVDALGSGSKWRNLVGTSFIDIVSKQDFRDQMVLGEFEGGIEAIIHMGACSSTTETDADYLYDNNFRYSTDVAEFALEQGARFIYASSAATYGDGSRGYSDATIDLKPLNMYGFSKHLFDCWIRDQHLDTHCVGLKFFNVFGPNEQHKGTMASMVYKAVQQIRATGEVRLFKSSDAAFADGGQMRDFIYVNDVCRVVLTLLKRKDINGIYNLGSGIASTWNELIVAVFAAMQIPPKIVYIEAPQEVAEQYQNYTQADMTAFAKALPDMRFSVLEDAVADYVQLLITE